MFEYFKQVTGVRNFHIDESRGFIYLVIRNGSDGKIVCKDLFTLSRTFWEIEISNLAYVNVQFGSKKVLVGTGDSLNVYNADNGQLENTVTLALHCGQDEFLIGEISREGGYALTKMDALNGDILWQVENVPMMTVKCNAKYLVAILRDNDMRKMQCFDFETGQQIWEADVSGYGKYKPNPFTTEQDCSLHHTAFIFQDVLIAPLSIGKLLVLDLGTGKEISLTTDVGYNIYVGRKDLAFELRYNQFASLNIAYGTKTIIRNDWNKKDPVISGGGPLTRFSISGNLIFGCSGSSAVIFALDKTNGNILWRENLPKTGDTFVPSANAPQYVSGKLFISDSEDVLHVLSENNSKWN